MSDLRDKLDELRHDPAIGKDIQELQSWRPETLARVVAHLIAQATADALEAAAQILITESRERERKAEVNDMERDKDSALYHRWDCILLNSLAAKIRALTPTHIAVKAKEREERYAAELKAALQEIRHESARDQLMNDTGDLLCKVHDIAARVLDAPDIAAKAKELRQELADCKDALYVASRQSEEHDAKIRREAYLRCADHSAFASEAILHPPKDNPPNIYAMAETFRKWANEADGGG